MFFEQMYLFFLNISYLSLHTFSIGVLIHGSDIFSHQDEIWRHHLRFLTYEIFI